jgi:hypothetical protein
MTKRDDLMERLAAADPLRESERQTPEEEREAEALLARLVATPPEHATEQRRAAPRRLRRLALAGAGLACAGLAALAAIDVLDSDAPGPGVVDKAIAAVTRDGVVYHVLDRRRVTGSAVPPGIKSRFVLYESWHTTDGRMHQKGFEDRGGRRGRLREEIAGRRPPGRSSGPALRYDVFQNLIHESGFGTSGSRSPSIDPYSDPGARLRELQRDGRLRVAGTEEVSGQTAYRLVSGVTRGFGGSPMRVEFLVEARTYLPLAQRYSVRLKSGKSFELSIRYLIYEQLPLNARTRGLLALDPHPGAKCSPGAGDMRGKRSVGFPNPCRGR